jgi:hypothetical protein
VRGLLQTRTLGRLSDAFIVIATRWASYLLPTRNVSSTPDAVRPLVITPTPTDVILRSKAERNPKPTASQDRWLGNCHFRGDVLDKLDSYFFFIRRMKRADPDAYALYSQVGASILPGFRALAKSESNILSRTASELPPWWQKQRPAFGAFAILGSEDEEQDDKNKNIVVPKFMYFQKYKTSPEMVQPTHGDVYVVTVYFDETNGPRKTGAPFEFAIAVGLDGSVRVLKSLIVSNNVIRSKHGTGRGDVFHVPTKRWGFDPHIRMWASDHQMPVENFLCGIFIFIADQIELGNSAMTRITASRGDLCAVFSVDPRRTSYFFRDREATVTKAGQKRRIFHIVRPHARTTNGVERFVRMHFRGEREFCWNGYDILITVPGKHHHNLAEFDVGATEITTEDAIGPNEMGASWAEHIRGGRLFTNPKRQRIGRSNHV